MIASDVRLEIAAPEGAGPHLAAWQGLAEQAEEPNAFLSPWMLLPAVRAFGAGRTVRLLFCYAPHPTHKAQPDVLVGFCALEERRSGVGLPVPVTTTFAHPALHLGTPLVRPGYAAAVVERLLAYVDDGRRVVTLRELRGDGPFHRALVDGLNARRWLHVGLRRSTRALLRPADSAETYLAQALAGKRRKELRRQHDRLHEQGGLSLATLAADEDPGPWLEDFLRLEAAGWKGRDGGEPMDGTAGTRQFFREAMGEGHRQGRLHLTALRLGDRPIAMKVNLLAGDGAFAFKIAFDEGWARYSPGVQLELENIHWFHQQPLRWMDSCAHHARFMINHLWMDRRPIEMLAFSNGHASTSLMVSLLPAVGWARRAATGAEA